MFLFVQQRKKPVTFRVEVLVSDRWMIFDGKKGLKHTEAHSIYCREAARVGSHRVRYVPEAR